MLVLNEAGAALQTNPPVTVVAVCVAVANWENNSQWASHWVEIYHGCSPWAACTCCPLAECSLVDDAIMF